MKIKKLNQHGIAGTLVLLILVLLLAVGGVGYYVWNAKKNTEKTLKDSAQGAGEAQKGEKKKKEVVKVEVDPTKDWIPFSSKEGQYNLKYPPTWTKAANLDSCNPGLLLLGGNAASTGKCATEFFGQTSVASVEGNQSADYELKVANYPDVASEAVTLNGVIGKKQTGTYKESGDEIVGTSKTGDKVVRYIFVTNGRTYTATYVKTLTFPDVLSDFNLVVTKTLKFTP